MGGTLQKFGFLASFLIFVSILKGNEATQLNEGCAGLPSSKCESSFACIWDPFNRICWAKKYLGENCTVDGECSYGYCGDRCECKFWGLGNQTCACWKGAFDYEGKCYFPRSIGGVCQLVIQCILGPPGNHSECVPEAHYKVCVCKPEAQERNGTCYLRKIGDPCEDSSNCPVGTCSQQKCLCKVNTIPSEDRDQCLEIIDELGTIVCQEDIQCQMGKPGKFSECNTEQDGITKVCRCQEGAVADENNCVQEDAF